MAALITLSPLSIAAAQTGAVAGRVTNATTNTPVPHANVQAFVGPERRAAATADENGVYRLSALAEGRYTISVLRVGQAVRRIENVVVRANQTTTLDVTTTDAAVKLEQIVVSSTGKPDKVVDAPADVSIVTQQAVAARPSLTVADHVKAMPGVDVSTGGIVQSNIVTRGFNNAFSGSLLTLQDYRFATVPSLRVNVPFLFTSVNEDIERVEMVLGPAAALYGPNSSAGVLHIVTRSPFDSPGSTLTLDGGSRAIARLSARNAGVITPKVAYKISGEYMRGEDWHYTDPGEPTNLTRNGSPAIRDFDVRRYVGEGRLDIRPKDGVELTTTYGLTNVGSAIDITGANGAAQVKDWTYQSIQQRLRWGNLFAQAFLNMSDAGNKDSLDQAGTYLLRTGQSIVDQSRVGAGSIQNSFDVGSRQRFIYGGDYIWTNPRTGYTIDGLNEDDDNVTEYGGYIHSLTRLSPQWEVTAALRADKNNRLEGTFLSPRASLVYKPAESQNFRFTYNRAYSTPANFSMFLDLLQARNVGGLPFNVRAMGVPPEGGWDYRRTCAPGLAGGLCMRSPFPSALGTPNTYVDANAAAYFPAVIQALSSRLPANLLPILTALNPTSAQVGSVMRYLGDSVAVNPSSLTPIEPLKASFVNNYEIGYKGLAGGSTRLSASGWYQQRINFITAAQNSTPNVFMDSTSLRTYLTTQITAALVAQGVPQAQAQATATAAAQQLTPGLASVPLGTVTFDNQKLANRPDVMYTYRNVDRTISLWGVDVGFDQTLTPRFSLEGTYSFVNKATFDVVSDPRSDSLRLNAPKNKGSLTLRFDDVARNFKSELRARYTEGFAVNSGVYASNVNEQLPGQTTCPPTGGTGCYQYAPVPTATLIDAGFTLGLPNIAKGASWSVNATNLLDHRVPTFVGVPSLGLLVMTRLQYNF